MSSFWTKVKPNPSNPEDCGLYFTIPFEPSNPIGKQILSNQVTNLSDALLYLNERVTVVVSTATIPDGFFWAKIFSVNGLPRPMKATFQEFLYIQFDVASTDLNETMLVRTRWSEKKRMRENGWTKTDMVRSIEREVEPDDDFSLI